MSEVTKKVDDFCPPHFPSKLQITQRAYATHCFLRQHKFGFTEVPWTGKKKREKVFCSNFMSFYPFELIFIGCVADIWRFYWVLRNFEFKPTNEIFLQKGKFPTFQKVLFLGVWCRKLSLNKIGVMDMSYIMDSGQNRLYTTFPNIFHYYRPIRPIYQKIKKIIFPNV